MQTTNDRAPHGPAQETNLSLAWWASAVGAMLIAGMAVAGNLSDAEARYRQDRVACMSGQSKEDRTACLREAGAALQEARRGRSDSDQKAYEKNRLLRCDRLPAADRDDCLRRMRGEGSISGSVEGGGIYRELQTTVPAQ